MNSGRDIPSESFKLTFPNCLYGRNTWKVTMLIIPSRTLIGSEILLIFNKILWINMWTCNRYDSQMSGRENSDRPSYIFNIRVACLVLIWQTMWKWGWVWYLIKSQWICELHWFYRAPDKRNIMLLNTQYSTCLFRGVIPFKPSTCYLVHIYKANARRLRTIHNIDYELILCDLSIYKCPWTLLSMSATLPLTSWIPSSK